MVRLIDGTKLKVPHRDSLSFGAPKEMLNGRQMIKGTSFVFYETGDISSMRLVNAMLVADVVPMKSNGNGHAKPRKQRKR